MFDVTMTWRNERPSIRLSLSVYVFLSLSTLSLALFFHTLFLLSPSVLQHLSFILSFALSLPLSKLNLAIAPLKLSLSPHHLLFVMPYDIICACIVFFPLGRHVPKPQICRGDGSSPDLFVSARIYRSVQHSTCTLRF